MPTFTVPAVVREHTVSMGTKHEAFYVDSGRWTDGWWTMDGGRLIVDGGQLIVDGGQLIVDS